MLQVGSGRVGVKQKNNFINKDGRPHVVWCVREGTHALTHTLGRPRVCVCACLYDCACVCVGVSVCVIRASVSVVKEGVVFP